jgi:hypothetical protein
MLALLLMLISVLILGCIVVMCYLYLHAGLSRSRLRSLQRRYAVEPVWQEAQEDSSSLYMKAVDEETSRGARLVLLILLILLVVVALVMALVLNGLL